MSHVVHPRPQFRRERWTSLCGAWQYSLDEVRTPDDVDWEEGAIQVPFPPEAALSGVDLAGPAKVVWYRRTFSLDPSWYGQRILLHFNAVDYEARVWVNGRFATSHIGGHTPFSVDISDHLEPGAEQEVVVQALDDPGEFDKPRGKQDWLDESHSIWYPRTTGIWQEVWLEPVPEEHLQSVRFTPRLSDLSIEVEVVASSKTEGRSLQVRLELDGRVLVQDSWSLSGSSVRRRIHLPDPGIDDAREAFLWSPENPRLMDVTLSLSGDEATDEVSSYTALRTVETRGGKFCLNGRPYFLRMVLDQGYWQDGLLAAPDAEALKRDVELARAMGFNGVRKHQKVEDQRYLYWADKLGLLVWAEMPSAYTFSTAAVTRLTCEWLEVLQRDYNHPCIVAWVPFNESWGVPDLPVSLPQRNLVAGLYNLTKALDPWRPVIGNDGWEYIAGDLFTIHDYDTDPDSIARRYRDRQSLERTVERFSPGGRALSLDPEPPSTSLPVLLTEFGGIRLADGEAGWGYDRVATPETLLDRYRKLVRAASAGALSGFCYTQFTDTFQERNGLLSMDRSPKIDLELLAKATRGETEAKEDEA